MPHYHRDNNNAPMEVRKYKRAPSITKLLSDARGVVQSLELQIHSPLMFPNQHGQPLTDFPQAYKRALEIAGINDTDVNFHTLRHTFASQLVMQGVDIPTLKGLLGHSDIKTTMRYAHLAPDHISRGGRHMPTVSDLGRAWEGHNY